MKTSKIVYKDFCKTQIEPFLINDEEELLYNAFDKYFKRLESTLDSKKGLFVRGVVGSGKTIMFKMVQRWLLNVRSIKMLNVERVVGNIEAGETYDRYLVGEWCFDDLGTEQKANQYGKGVEVFKRVVEERYDSWKYSGLITHFTSNLSNEELLDRYGERAYDRLKEMCNVIKYPNSTSKRGKSVVKPLIEYHTDEVKEVTKEEREAKTDQAYSDLMIEFIEMVNKNDIPKIIVRGNSYLSTIYIALDREGMIEETKEEKKEVYSKELLKAEAIHKKRKFEGKPSYTTVEDTAKLNSRAFIVKRMYLKGK